MMHLELTDMKSVLRKIEEVGAIPVLSSLKESRSKLHPDKNGGEFKSDEEKHRYYFLDEAVRQVEMKVPLENHLVPISQLPALIEVITKTIASRNSPAPIELERAYKEFFKSELSHKYIGPKVGSGIFAAITGFLFAQAPDLASHPIVGPFIETPFGMQFLGAGFLVSIVMFLLTWTSERQEEALSNFLLSEEALMEIYSIIRESSSAGEIGAGDIRRSIRMRYLGHHIDTPFKLLIRPRLSSGSMDRILEVQIERLIERKVLVVVDVPSIERVYRVVS